MLPINLIGLMNLLPMNFTSDLLTETRSHYIIILETSTLNRNQTNLSQLLIRPHRCYMIVLPNTLSNINKSFVKIIFKQSLSSFTKFLFFSKGRRFHKNFQSPKFSCFDANETNPLFKKKNLLYNA